MGLYKILVADDEQIVLDAIRFIVERNFNGKFLIETAASGREAIEKAENVKPDIILMDIKMPGINGIEAIKEIKSRYSNALFVIITAYEQFDFAKEAVKLGVADYLLKPANHDKIVETIQKLIGIIEQQRRNRKKELELREKLENVLPVLENGLIYSIILLEDNKEELESYRNIFEIDEDTGYIMTVEFGEKEVRGKIGNIIGMSVKSQSFYPYFRDTIKNICRCIVGPVMLNRIVVFIPSDYRGDEYSHRLDMLNIASLLYDRISEKVDSDFYIGIGRCYKGLENLQRSYEESLKAIRCAEGKGIVHIMDIPNSGRMLMEYPFSKEKQLLEKAAVGETGTCLQLFTFIFDWLDSQYGSSIQEVKVRLLEIMILIQRLAWDHGIDDNEFIRRHDYMLEMLSIDESSQLRVWCKERIEYITRNICIVREKKINSLILRTKDYIDKNFDKEITLEDVSKEIKISPHYFSRLFKEEMGEGFIEYLTLIRMQKAKEFLEKGIYSIKEICYMVGYGDPNYFSRAFKKAVGVTPTEFKENSVK